jgi:hypothetical protein
LNVLLLTHPQFVQELRLPLWLGRTLALSSEEQVTCKRHIEYKDAVCRIQQLQAIQQAMFSISQQQGCCTSYLIFHDPVQVDLAFPANSRTITRLMDAWWDCKVIASMCLLTCVHTRTACRSSSNPQTYGTCKELALYAESICCTLVNASGFCFQMINRM